jgi:hypothetical protein
MERSGVSMSICCCEASVHRHKYKIYISDNIHKKDYEVLKLSFDLNPGKPYRHNKIQASEIYIEDINLDYKIAHFSKDHLNKGHLKEIIDSQSVEYWSFHSSSQINLHLKDGRRLVFDPNHDPNRQDMNTGEHTRIPIFSFNILMSLLVSKYSINTHKWDQSGCSPEVDSISFSIQYISSDINIDAVCENGEKIYDGHLIIRTFPNNYRLVILYSVTKLGVLVGDELRGEYKSLSINYNRELFKHHKKILQHWCNIKPKEINRLFREISPWSKSQEGKAFAGYDSLKKIAAAKDIFIIYFTSKDETGFV